MTYIVKYLPLLEQLKNELENNPENIKHYIKYEGYSGSSDSIDYLETKIKEYYESKKN
jgi:hypothetical protein